MSLKKNINNIVVGFDLKLNKVRILHNLGSDLTTYDIDDFIYTNDYASDDKIGELLSNALGGYLKGKTVESTDAYIVLADDLVTIDFIKVPLMQESKMKEALNTELKKLYTNINNLEFNSTILTKSKKQAIFAVTFVEKNVLFSCQSVCKKFNLNLKSVSYYSNSTINSLFGQNFKLRHGNFAYVDVKENSSAIVYVSHDRVVDFIDIPFGQNFISSETVNYEGDFISSNSADFLKYNITNGTDFDLITFEFNNDYMRKFKEAQKQNYSRIKSIEEKSSEMNNSGLLNKQKNFEVVLKYVSVLNEDIKQKGFAEIENVIVNCHNVIDFNLDNLSDEFKMLSVYEDLNLGDELMANLDLLGMIYAVNYNKGQNFLDREKQSITKTLSVTITALIEKIKEFFKNLIKKDKNEK